MKYYYLNLQDEEDSSNKKIGEQFNSVRKTLGNFEEYLNNVFQSLKEREIKAKWRKIDTEDLFKLELIGNLYEIENKEGLYKMKTSSISDTCFDPTKDFVYYKIKGEPKPYRTTITREQYDQGIIRINTLNNSILDNTITLCTDKIEIEPLWNINSQNIEGVVLRKDIEKIIVYIQEKDKKLNKEYKKYELQKYISRREIAIFIKENFNGELRDEENFIFSIPNKIVKNEFTIKQLNFAWRKQKNIGDKSFKIQLEELDKDSESDEILSPLRFFFDDDITILDGENRGIEYVREKGECSEDENILLLRRKDQKEYCFPDSTYLIVKVNTYQIQKQQEAIVALKNMPIGSHRNLIKLFEKLENEDGTKRKIWENPGKELINQWNILTDEKRDGCLEQRDFVQKAINTPDFAILEGPPGSGKTTVILELITQLVQRGKRILLCGSTHIAIDNVLERLDKKINGSSLLEQYHILPVRIGDEQRISESIGKYQLNKFLNENKEIDQRLLFDLANLVCGTTIGILQHPKFRREKGLQNTKIKSETGEDIEKEKHVYVEPIVPEYDYLIIDESSKTTFQEFLVPALYAKKWILVGDIMQLSPFTDSKEIVSNIKYLIPEQKQKAIFYLEALKKNKDKKYILPIEKEVIEEIYQELRAGRYRGFEKYNGKIQKEDDKKELYIFCAIVNSTSQEKEERTFIQRRIENTNRLELAVSDVILIDKNIFPKCIKEKLLPETHAVLLRNDWENTEHFFSYRYYNKDNDYESINQYFKNKSWADEIAWRMNRSHENRMGGYQQRYENLLPLTEDIRDKIGTIYRIAFPSILESLVKGIEKREKDIRTTITEGFKFDKENLDCRYTILKYQHRMHPDISNYPRNQFYTKEGREALLDLSSINIHREWKYERYNKHSIWVDVKNIEKATNKNEEEAKRLIEHLEKFINYAKNTPPPNNGNEWSVACLTFYRGQETLLRNKLRRISNEKNNYSNFRIEGKYKINIKLHTVDKFQGQEADIVFLSMVRNQTNGFIDNPNRLNVAVTRAKFQLVIIGDYDYFAGRKKGRRQDSEELLELAKNNIKYKEE
jgi:hypothetical protein